MNNHSAQAKKEKTALVSIFFTKVLLFYFKWVHGMCDHSYFAVTDFFLSFIYSFVPNLRNFSTNHFEETGGKGTTVASSKGQKNSIPKKAAKLRSNDSTFPCKKIRICWSLCLEGRSSISIHWRKLRDSHLKKHYTRVVLPTI